MKPYIAIAEKTKADAMKLFDEDFGIQINFVKLHCRCGYFLP